MAKYKVTFKKSVAKDLRSIPNIDVQRILEKINSISEEPRAEGCIKLSAHELYRTRQGLYRIVYEIRDETLVINVVKVGQRSSVYKSIYRLKNCSPTARTHFTRRCSRHWAAS